MISTNAEIGILQGEEFLLDEISPEIELTSLGKRIFGPKFDLPIVISDLASDPIIYPIDERIETVKEYLEGSLETFKNSFLNDVEFIYFLLHDNNRLNIENEDPKLRVFLVDCTPTALTCLCRFADTRSTSRRDILNALADKKLDKIPEFVLKVMREVERSLQSTDDLSELLISYGIVAEGRFNSAENVLETNLIQIEEYKSVIPDRKFRSTEVVGKQGLFLKSYLKSLSDQELLGISMTLGDQKFTLQEYRERSLIGYDRTDLLDDAYNFLTQRLFYIEEKRGTASVGYGSLIDTKRDLLTLEEFASKLKARGCLYAQGPLTEKEATSLLKRFPAQLEILGSLLNKLKEYKRKGKLALYQLTPEQREIIGERYSELLGSAEAPDENDLKEVLKLKFDPLVHAYRNGEFILLSLDLSDYLTGLYVEVPELLKETLEFYTDLFSV